MWNLVYVSAARPPFVPDDLAAILSAARQRNAAHGVTGLLLHADGNFMQVLEGEADDVERIYADICRDQRHSGLIKLLHSKVDERHFGNWTMAFRRKSDLTPEDQAHFADSVSRWSSKPLSNSDGAAALELIQSFARTM